MSLWKLSRLVPRKSSVAPVLTVVFTQGAIATEMTGGNASRPIVCRGSTGPTINDHPSARPAIVALTCAISAEGCSGQSLLPTGIRIAKQLLPGPFPPEAPTSRSLPRWRRRLPAISISLLRTILADMMMRSSGKLLSEPGDILLAKLGALYVRRRNLRRPQPRSRPRENLRLAWRGIKPAPAARRPKRPRMRLFVQPSGIRSLCLERLLLMRIPSRSPPLRVEIPLRISPNFDRGEYRSSDVFDRMDVAVVGDANAHTR